MRLDDAVLRVDDLRGLLVRRMPRQNKRNTVSFGDRELGDRAEVLAAELHVAAEMERVRPGDRAEVTRLGTYPRHHRAVVETHDELHPHVDTSAESLHQPNDVRVLVADRHAVGQPDGAVGRLELGLEDQRSRPISPAGLRLTTAGRDEPPTVLVAAEERREAGAGVEP